MNHPIRPYSEEDFQHPFDSESQVVSSTECTGMIPSAATEKRRLILIILSTMSRWKKIPTLKTSINTPNGNLMVFVTIGGSRLVFLRADCFLNDINDMQND